MLPPGLPCIISPGKLAIYCESACGDLSFKKQVLVKVVILGKLIGCISVIFSFQAHFINKVLVKLADLK